MALDTDPEAAVHVHSVQEEYFFLMVHPCACGGPWLSNAQRVERADGRVVHHVTARCVRCTRQRTFHFELAHDDDRDRPVPVRQINPTPEASRAIDLAEWIELAQFYLERIARLRGPVEKAQSLLDARQCLEEALKFYGPADQAPPPSALWSEKSRQKVAARPDAFRRARVEEKIARIPPTEALQKVDAPVQKQFEDGLKKEARRRTGPWWQFWKRWK